MLTNNLQYKLFCSGTADSGHLPPTQDELRLQITRLLFGSGHCNKTLMLHHQTVSDGRSPAQEKQEKYK